MGYTNKHKEEIIRATQLWECGDITRENLEYIFPELKESEDERIRKAIIEFFESEDDNTTYSLVPKKDILAWLKKQGGQKSIDDLTQQEAMDIAVAKCFEQGKQKPTNKLEPKFHKGNWITDGYLHNKITDVLEDRYIVETKFAKRSAILFEHESRYHLWTIEDAKDGDVLLFEGYYNSIVLFQGIGINGKGRINYHCKCDLGNYSFGVQGDMACLGTIEKDAEHYHPATKEQRDLLFQKMKEEGYEWDANKKKLNKIHVIDEGKAEMDYCFTKMMNGEKVSSAWSEEDEKMVKDIIAAIDTLYYHGMVNWLKSLKDRVQHQNKWKPSKEQIIALRWVLNNIPYNKHKEEISELLDQIKDL